MLIRSPATSIMAGNVSSSWHCGQVIATSNRRLTVFDLEEKQTLRLFGCNYYSLCRACFDINKSLTRLRLKFCARRKEGHDSTQTQSSSLSLPPARPFLSSSVSDPPQKEEPPSKKRKTDLLVVEYPDGKRAVVPQVATVTVKYLINRKYGLALKALGKLPYTADGLGEAVAFKIKQEARYFCHTTQFMGMEIFPFKTELAYNEMRDKAPVMTAAMLAVVKQNKREKAGARVFAAAMILLQTRNNKCNAFQKILSVLLWKGQLRSIMFRRLQHFGLTLSRPRTLSIISTQASEYDRKVQKWKQEVAQQENVQTTLSIGTKVTTGEEVEEEGAPVQEKKDEDTDIIQNHVHDRATLDSDHINVQPPTEYSDQETVSSAPDAEPTSNNQLDQPGDVELEQEATGIEVFHDEADGQEMIKSPEYKPPHPGYQLVFDNLNWYQRKRHKTSRNANKQHNLVQAYAVLDRINCEDLPNDKPILEDVRTIPEEKWWLPVKEQDQIMDELKILILRIAQGYFHWLKELPKVDHVDEHIHHQYSHQSSSKSDVNKLGILQFDEMYTGQMIALISQLQQFCPKTADKKYYTVPLGGDGMSVQKASNAQRGRVDGFNAEDKLDGVLPKPEDWHEGVILLQDTFKVFYSTKSLRDKGTLFHLRELFDRRGVKASAKDAVNDNREFLHFVTHGFVVLAIMHVLGVDNLEEVPTHFPSDADDIDDFMEAFANRLVKELIFPDGVLPSGNQRVTSAAEDHKWNYICALMREGLLDMARLDAVKEGDGERILRHWRYDFIHFHVYNHPNYRLLTFNFIAQVYGQLTPRLAARLIHNRTVNVHGGVGKNISLDLFLEFLNKDVKEDLKRSGPNVTSKLLDRIGQSKQVMDELLEVLDQHIELYTGIGRHQKPDWSGEIAEMVEELKDDLLFSNQPGRAFTTFPNFPRNKLHTIDQQKFKDWVKTHLELLHSP